MITIKTLILAAGYATRMYPLTENQPKPLLKVGKKSIIEHQLERLKELKEVEEIFIVTNARFYDQFRIWLNNLSYPKKITLINDGTLSKDDRLGAVGDINFALKEAEIEDDVLVLAGDNLFDDDLQGFLKFFQQKGTSIMLHDVKDKELAKLYGIVTLNSESQIMCFVEKPLQPESTLASTLIYALKKEHLPLLQEAIRSGCADRTGDFICYLAKKKPVYGMNLKGKWFDIGSFEQLKAAESFFK